MAALSAVGRGGAADVTGGGLLTGTGTAGRPVNANCGGRMPADCGAPKPGCTGPIPYITGGARPTSKQTRAPRSTRQTFSPVHDARSTSYRNCLQSSKTRDTKTRTNIKNPAGSDIDIVPSLEIGIHLPAHVLNGGGL